MGNIIAGMSEPGRQKGEPDAHRPDSPFNRIFTFLKRTRTSLTFIVVTSLVLLALVPVALVATGNYLQSRNTILEQTAQELQNLVKSQSSQLLDIANTNQAVLDDFLGDPQFLSLVTPALGSTTPPVDRKAAAANLQTYLQANQPGNRANIDGILVLNPQNRVVASSKPEWIGLDLSGVRVIAELAGARKTIPAFSPSSLYTNQWVTLSSAPIQPPTGSLRATLVVATFPSAPRTILETTSSLFTDGTAYFVSIDDTLVGISPRTSQIIQLPTSSTHSENLRQIFQGPQQEGSGQFDDPNLVPVFVYAKWLPEINLGFAVEVPERVIFHQIDALLPFTLLLLGISLVLIAVLVFFGARAFVNPIVQLTQSARNFARGDWSERSEIRRADEIGVLARTFNQMVEQISDLYRSMEQKVEERARQLRTASEVGQLATSASNRDEIIERAVRLVIDRFGYSFSSIFLVDPSGSSLVLMASYSQSGEIRNQKGYRVNIGSDTLVGWVAKNNQARVISDFASSDFPPNSLQSSSSKSEAALPIAIGNRILGVFEVQSIHSRGFEPESISVLQTISNQIANGLQNLRLLEATQINLEETSLLYRTSRQISQTHNEAEMLQVVREALAQTAYISGIFSVREQYLEITTINDPRNPASLAAPQGITLPLMRLSPLLEGNQMILVEDLSRPSEYDVLLSFFARRNCNSAAIFTISSEGNLAYIIVLGSRENAPLTQTGMQPFSNLMEVITTTRQRFQILENLEGRVTTLQILSQVSEAISPVTDLRSLYQTLHNQVSAIVGEDISFLIALHHPEQAMIEIPYVYEGNELISIQPFPIGEGLTSYVILNRKALMIVSDAERRIQQLGAKQVGKPAKSWLGVPLIVSDQAIGVLVLQDTEHEERFTQNDLNLFMVLAPQVAVTLRNVQLLDQMQQAIAAFEKERFLLNTLMENTPDQVYFKDLGGRFIRVSKSYAQTLGGDDPLALIGKSNLDVFSAEVATVRNQAELKILEEGQPVLAQVTRIKVADRETWKQSSLIPMIDEENKQVGLLGIDHDITALKQTEELAMTRAQELQIAAEIARDTSGTLDTAQLLSNAVEMIRDRFGFYHASVFLMDTLGEYAVLSESTGEVGDQMKTRGHRLAVGSQSIVGQVTARKEAWVINDVRQEPLYYANPLLPETRAELAIPLIVGERILGAIDVQSTQADVFTPEKVQILQILADQLAIAVWNSILYGQSQENLAQHRLLHQISLAASSAGSVDEALATTVQALHTATGGEQVMVMYLNEDRLQVRTAAGYEDVNFSDFSLMLGEGIPGLAAQIRQPVRINDLNNHPEYTSIHPYAQSELAVPIFFSDRVIGVLDLASPRAGAYDETDQEILASLGNTLGAIIANVRLVQEVRQQVERQRRLMDATNQIRRTVDIQTILQTSTREIARSLGAKRAHIEINIPQPGGQEEDPTLYDSSGNGNGNGHGSGGKA